MLPHVRRERIARRIADRHAVRITVQLVTRVPDDLASAIDELIRSGSYGSRSEVVRAALAIVAPVTRTVRGIPTEVALGPDDGLPVECAASFDNLQPLGRHLLTSRVGGLSFDRRPEICRALRALADC